MTAAFTDRLPAPPELAPGNLLRQECGRLEAVTEGLLKECGDAQPDVQAHEVGQPQRTHRVPVSERHRGIDVFRTGHPLLQHADRLEADRDADNKRGEQHGARDRERENERRPRDLGRVMPRHQICIRMISE